MTPRERPIIFSDPMVRAILAGRKTQTRRIIRPQPDPDSYVGWFDNIVGRPASFAVGRPMSSNVREISCPYGKAGYRLWVRETWHACPLCGHDQGPTRGRCISYRAGGWARAPSGAPDDGGERDDASQPTIGDCSQRGWRSPIFMPRWASRITLEVTRVWPERLLDISEADAKAEGLACVTKDGTTYKYGIPDRDGWPGTDDDGWPWREWEVDPRKAYWRAWDKIHGKTCPSASNPWVWAWSSRRLSNDKAHEQ